MNVVLRGLASRVSILRHSPGCSDYHRLKVLVVNGAGHTANVGSILDWGQLSPAQNAKRRWAPSQRTLAVYAKILLVFFLFVPLNQPNLVRSRSSQNVIKTCWHRLYYRVLNKFTPCYHKCIKKFCGRADCRNIACSCGILTGNRCHPTPSEDSSDLEITWSSWFKNTDIQCRYPKFVFTLHSRPLYCQQN